MDSCEWKLTDGELAEIREKRIVELTAEVDRLAELNKCVEESCAGLGIENRRLRDAAKDMVAIITDAEDQICISDVSNWSLADIAIAERFVEEVTNE